MIRLADTLGPMADFPVALAEHIQFEDGDTLQKKFNDEELGGGDNSLTITQEEYDNLSIAEQLDGLYYTYDTKRIYKNGIQYGANEPLELTMDEFKALKEAGALDEKQEYIITTNENGVLLEASDIGYNGTASGLSSLSVQGVIDEVNDKIDNIIDDENVNENTVLSSKKTMEEINGIISDTTSSTKSTYSSAKIDKKFAPRHFGTDNATLYLKLQLGTMTTHEPITVTDQYGGQVKILGMYDLSTYKSVKVIRLSYGDWSTHSGTDFTNTSSGDVNYKIRHFFYCPDDNNYYLEIRQYSYITVEGAPNATMVTNLPVEVSEMTLIPESNWGNINDSATNTTSTWSSSKIASEINHTIDISKVFSDGTLNIATLCSTYGNGRYVIVGQGTAGNGSATIDIWTLVGNAISYTVNVTYSNRTSNIFVGYTYDNPTINFETGYINSCNHIAKVCTLA